MIAIGPTTIVGWATALAGSLPTVIKVLQGANHLGEPQKISALVGLISLALTQIGRYAQAHKIAK